MRFFEYWAWNGPWPGVARVASRPPAKQEAHPDGMGVAGGDGTAPGIAAHARGRRRGVACTKANATWDANVFGK